MFINFFFSFFLFFSVAPCLSGAQAFIKNGIIHADDKRRTMACADKGNVGGEEGVNETKKKKIEKKLPPFGLPYPLLRKCLIR
jgi:hypothetical protein